MSQLSNSVRKEIVWMAHGYMVMTAIFYVLLPVVMRIAPLQAVGGHASYYALMWGLMLEDVSWSAGPVLQKVFAVIALGYPVALITCYIILLRKRCVLPFGILAIFSWLLTTALLVVAIVSLITNGLPQGNSSWGGWFAVVGNAVYCYYYFSFYKGNGLQVMSPDEDSNPAHTK